MHCPSRVQAEPEVFNSSQAPVSEQYLHALHSSSIVHSGLLPLLVDVVEPEEIVAAEPVAMVVPAPPLGVPPYPGAPEPPDPPPPSSSSRGASSMVPSTKAVQPAPREASTTVRVNLSTVPTCAIRGPRPNQRTTRESARTLQL